MIELFANQKSPYKFKGFKKHTSLTHKKRMWYISHIINCFLSISKYEKL